MAEYKFPIHFIDYQKALDKFYFIESAEEFVPNLGFALALVQVIDTPGKFYIKNNSAINENERVLLMTKNGTRQIFSEPLPY